MTGKKPEIPKVEEIKIEDLDEAVGGIDKSSPYLKGEARTSGADGFQNVDVTDQIAAGKVDMGDLMMTKKTD